MLTQGELISPRYRVMQRILHAQPEGYGTRGNKWADAVGALVSEYQASSVLDYGCGQGTLKVAVKQLGIPGLRFSEYDPGIPGKETLPTFADLVVATDVLEHVEPERLMAVLAHLKLLARKAVFVVVALVPSAKILADGRNAHLIIRPALWWRKKFAEAGFTVKRAPDGTRKKKSHELTVVLEP